MPVPKGATTHEKVVDDGEYFFCTELRDDDTFDDWLNRRICMQETRAIALKTEGRLTQRK